MEEKTSANIERTTAKNNYSHFFSHLLYRFFFSSNYSSLYLSYNHRKHPSPRYHHHHNLRIKQWQGDTNTISFHLKRLPKHPLPLHSLRKSLYHDGKENVLSHWRWGYFVLLLRLITVPGGIKAPLISVRYPWEILHWRFL